MNVQRLCRPVGLILTALLALYVLGDPYTFHLNGSDAIWPAPVWQTALALLDVGLLALLAGLVVRRRARAALTTLTIETLYNLGLTTGLVWRDGLARFDVGFGGQDVSRYLLLLMVRVVFLFILAREAIGTAKPAA